MSCSVTSGRVGEAIAVLDRQHGEPDRAERHGARNPASCSTARGVGDAVVAQQRSQALGRAGAVGGDEHAPAGVALGVDAGRAPRRRG